MNKRKLICLKNMQKRIRRYAYNEERGDIQYELMQLYAQFENVFAWADEL